MPELSDTVQETIEQAGASRLHSMVAMLVALSATFMAVCNIKDGNIVQAMAQAQARGVDTWSHYQAKSTRQNITENALDLLQIDRARAPREEWDQLDGKVREYKARVDRYGAEKEQIRKEAEGYQALYDELNVHDDQFDMAEALLSVALAVYGVSALTDKRWLLWMGMLLSGAGALLGVAGFLGWSTHPDWLAKVLG